MLFRRETIKKNDVKKKDKNVTTLVLLIIKNEYKETVENLERIIIKKLLSLRKQQKEI